ncbi:MAG: DUF2974 domain-containing protein, partial [Clostridia bacterium]|nr:DUF2974 domain-containing protein [Clostridia bacterium]
MSDKEPRAQTRAGAKEKQNRADAKRDRADGTQSGHGRIGARRARDGIFAYLRWRGDLPLSAVPPTEVDGLILAMDCFLNYTGIVPRDFDGVPVDFCPAVEAFFRRPAKERHFGAIIPDIIGTLAEATARAPRFGGVKLIGYDKRLDKATQEQFGALTYLLPDGSLYVTYQGTDDSLIGWKENFMLAFVSPVRAQIRAADYLTRAARAFPDAPIRVAGHSKGGNLALYAAACAPPDVQDRLVSAFSFDGPGFMPSFFEEPGFARVADRLWTYIPESSIVGALLEHSDRFCYIASTEKNILQHDPFSWVAEGDRFARREERSAFGRRADRAFCRWIGGITMTQRQQFTDSLFSVLTAPGLTLTDIISDKLRSTRMILSSFAKLPKADRSLMFGIFHRLLRAAREHGEDEMRGRILPPKETVERARAAETERKTSGRQAAGNQAETTKRKTVGQKADESRTATAPGGRAKTDETPHGRAADENRAKTEEKPHGRAAAESRDKKGGPSDGG